MPIIPTITEYRFLLESFAEIPSDMRAENTDPITQLLAPGAGYEVLLDGAEIEPKTCSIVRVVWNNHADDLNAFSAVLEVDGRNMEFSVGELLANIIRRLPNGECYSGQRIRALARTDAAA